MGYLTGSIQDRRGNTNYQRGAERFREIKLFNTARRWHRELMPALMSGQKYRERTKEKKIKSGEANTSRKEVTRVTWC